MNAILTQTTPSRTASFDGAPSSRSKRDIIVIVASAGSVYALQQLLSMLPADLRAAIGCVLHRGPTASQLAAVLGHHSALPVREPTQGEAVRHGMVYLAPADHHLLFQPEGIEIPRGPREHGTRPAVDPLFRSAATTYGKRVVGLLLTGAGQDGLDGMIAISQSAGWNLVQHPEEAYMPSMPLAALHGDHVCGAYRLADLPAVLTTLAGGGSPDRRSAKGKTAKNCRA
jgi:two-component system, chemotaxis family, protein-glutamate methylesterase/glutaminase